MAEPSRGPPIAQAPAPLNDADSKAAEQAANVLVTTTTDVKATIIGAGHQKPTSER